MSHEARTPDFFEVTHRHYDFRPFEACDRAAVIGVCLSHELPLPFWTLREVFEQQAAMRSHIVELGASFQSQIGGRA